MKLIRQPKTVVKLVFSNNVQCTLITALEFADIKKQLRDGIANGGIREIESLTEQSKLELGAECTIVNFDHIHAIVITEINDVRSVPQQEKIIDANGNVKTAITLEAPPKA